MKTDWPHWLPKGASRLVELTPEQFAYILPVYNLNKNHTIDGITLHENKVSGHRIAFLEFLKRFRYSDLNVSNLENAAAA